MSHIVHCSDVTFDGRLINAYFAAYGRKGWRAKLARVPSGLLKAAEKRGEISAKRSWSRIGGSFITYQMTSEQLESIRLDALRRAGKS